MSPTTKSNFISIQVQMFASHIHPGDVLHLTWSRKLHLSSIQVPSHAHPGLKLCVTPPSRSCLTCIQIPMVLSHPHPGLTTIQVRNYVSHLHPSQAPLHSSHDICITAPSMSYLNPIQVSTLSSELHPGHVSPPARFHLTPSRSPDVHLTSVQFSIVASLFHPGCVSPPPRSWHLHLTSIQVVSSPFRWRDLQLRSIHVLPHSSFYILSKVYCNILT